MIDFLLVGIATDQQVGGHFMDAADVLGLEARVVDTRTAASSRWLDRITWRFNRRRPFRMKRFEQQVLRECETYRPRVLLVTGLAPLSAKTIKQVKNLGVCCVNFLTDDPWNPGRRTAWLLNAIAQYDIVFTPRHSNSDQLSQIGVPIVRHLPFAYSERYHQVESPQESEAPKDLLFVGGADGDRNPILGSLVDKGFKLALCGRYWEGHQKTAPFAMGLASTAELRDAALKASVTLLLVRRANRDGHVMRSFESAAGGGCLLVEDTEEHRAIFGDDGCVSYFHDNESMIANLRELLSDRSRRDAMRKRVYEKICITGKHTYKDRLAQILAVVDQEANA